MHLAIQSIHTLEGCNAPVAFNRRGIPVWLVPLILVIVLLTWYRVLNGSTNWASWITFLVLDFSVTFLGIVLLLVLRPMSTIIIPPKQPPTQDTTPQRPSIVRDEEVPLTATASNAAPPTGRGNDDMISGDTTSSDIAVTIHMIVFLVGWISSCTSDNVATYIQSDMSVPYFLAFLIFDMIENFFYISAFATLAVCYRTIAIQVWNIQLTIEETFEDITKSTHDHSHSTTLSNLQSKLSESLTNYEKNFDITEALSGKTGYVAVLLIALATMEMASTLHDVFTEEGGSIDWTDINHLAIFRLLVVIASLILQVGLAAADLMYASERLAEALARLDSALRMQVVLFAKDDTTSISHCAPVCRAFGDRVRNHPARIRLSWFHLTTEWAMGVLLLVFALLLAVFGIELPGGE